MNKHNYFLSFMLILSCLNPLASQNYGALVAGVTSIQTSGVPSDVITTTSINSAAIAGKPSAAISIASITPSNGRMLTVAHEGFFIDGDINLVDNLVFATNAVNWLCPAGRKSILISTGHREWAFPGNMFTFTNKAISNGYSVTFPAGGLTSANLAGIGLVVIGNAWGDISQAELDALATHLQNGGGILVMGLGWSWTGNPNDYPMNKVAALAGQRFATPTNPSPITSFYPNVLPNVSTTYCASKGNTPWQEWIANVQFGTINNASQKEGYGNFTSQTTTVTKGTSYPLSILQGFSWAADPTNATQQGKVWIDYNQNGTFEVSELVASFTRTTVTANITIPTTALTGATRMRVSLKTTGAPTACEVFEKGEVEDYSVNITGGVTATQPDLTITDVVAPSSARVNEPLSYSFRFKNVGTTAVLPNSFSPINVYATLVSVINANDFYGNASILLYRDVAAGFDSLITFRSIIPQFLPAGNYNLVLETDTNSSIIESNETNNKVSVPITINPALTDNRKLKITSVTGPTTGVPNGNLPLSITIKNEGTVPSNEDSVSYVKFSQANFNVGVFDLPYSPTKVAVPPIPAGGSVTIAANFVLPSTLVSVKALLTSKNQAFEPFLILEEQRIRNSPLGTSGTADLATKFFYYPITPASRADIAVTGRVLSTYTTQNKLLNFELTIKNNGPDRAQNVRIVLDSFFSRSGSFQVKDGLVNLTIVSPQIGITQNLFTQNGSLEEDVTQRPTYTLESIDANQTVTVALRATILPKEFFGPGERVTPDTFIISPKIIYVDAVDNNAANNQTSPLIFFKNPNNELTITSCPQNVTVTAALGATSAPATFSEPTGTSTAACGATGGVIALRRSGPFDGNYPIGVTEVVYELNDRCGNSKFCRFTITVIPQTNNLPDLSSVDGFNDTYFSFVTTKSVITGGRITVKNFGTATVSTPHAVSLYFSTDTILSANDILIGKKSITKPLAAGDTAIIRSEEFIFPDNIQGGNYYFIIKTDADNAVTEFSETNNVKYINAFISNPNMSAFLFAGLNQNDTIVRGREYTLRTDFSFSQGFPRKDKFSLKFYFSKDSTLSADDYIISALQDSFRTSGNQLVIPFNTSLIPATFTSGIYYIIYEIDNENVIFESNERDNKAYVRVNWDNGVVASNADLTLANLNVPTPSVLQGNILNFAFDLKNIGTSNATTNFNIKSYLSKDQTLSADDYQDGAVPTANLAAGVTTPQVAGAMTVRNTVAAGQYYLILKVDGDDQIVESNENNNVAVSSGLITVTSVVNNSCRFQDSLQLVRLYNATGGANWTRKWNLNTPIDTWIGVSINPDGCVRAVVLPNNNLVGTLPNLNLPNVTYLGLDQNKISGALPNLILPNLTQLFLNENQLSGAIPNFNLPNVTDIYLRDNQLSGTIPNFNLPKLAGLFLEINQLSGAIPNFNLLPNLKILVLYTNQLSGAIPNFNIPSLVTLALDSNRLTGTIPNFNLPNLVNLSLVNNQLTGSIPSFNFPNLAYLHVEKNQLSGCIPLALKAFCGKNVDISANPNLATQDFAAFCSANNTGACSVSTSYCAAKGTAPWEYWVGNVSLGTINNTSDKFKDFATLGYSDYTSISTTLNKGQSYPLSIAPGLSWIGNVPNAYCRVWIDFNQNNAFEANELVLEKTNQNPLTQSVLIPTTALTGNTRMRVALKFGAYPTVCETFDRGEVEDYTVNIQGGTVGGTPNLVISNVTGPAMATPGSQITLAVTVTNTGTAATVPTKLFYRLKNFQNIGTIPLTDNALTIAPLSPNETRVINYTMTLKNPIYPPNASYISSGFSPYNFADYYVIASNDTLSGGAPNPTVNETSFKFNFAPIFPQANVSVNVVPNKTTLQRNEKWNATYTVKNNSTTLLKQVFVNLGSFANLGRNFLGGNYQVDSVSNIPPNSILRTSGAETWAYGLEVFELAAGETRTITLFFSKIISTADIGDPFPNPTVTGILQFPVVNIGSNVINTNTTVGANIPITAIVIPTDAPDLVLLNLNIPTPSVQQGQILNFKFDLKNQGITNATGNFNIKSYLSTDRAFSASDYQDGIVPTANLAAGVTNSQVEGAMTVSSAVPAGQYYLILKVDADNQITESNENNNLVFSTGLITVTGGTTGGGADLALRIVSTPSVFTKYSVNTMRVTAQNVGNQTLTNVKVELKRPALTSNGGSKVPSVGTFQDFCPGGIECSEWTIPTLAAGASATLDAPFFILDANAPIVVTTKLLGSTPTDANTTNNTASVTINPAAAGATAPILGLRRQTPTQYIPLIVQSISPNPSEGDVVVEVESLTAQEVQFEFSNAMGQVVQSEKRGIEKGINRVHFDVYEFTQGIYFIQTNVGKGRNAPTKFVKF
jgi:subtilase family serine protease